jgi:hypothetical protein
VVPEHFFAECGAVLRKWSNGGLLTGAQLDTAMNRLLRWPVRRVQVRELFRGDTVDVAYELVTRATTHRGLYVGMTRGREANHLLVVTDTAVARDAQDVLEQILANERADLSAVAQRRHLARQAQAASRAPRTVIPDWFEAVVTRLVERRDLLHRRLGLADERRRGACRDLVGLQPDLDAARAAWQPYASEIDNINEQLRERLRPVWWAARRDAEQAGVGHRRAARHRLTDARHAVDDAEAAIRAVQARGAAAKCRLDELALRARSLHEAADPRGPSSSFDDLDRSELAAVERLLDALDTLAVVGPRTPVPAAGLSAAVATISDAARHAALVPAHPADLDHTKYNLLLSPVAEQHPDRRSAPRPTGPGLEL